MTVSERAEIVINVLEIYRKVQEKGGLPSQKREVLDLFHDVMNASHMSFIEEKTLEFINRGVE